MKIPLIKLGRKFVKGTYSQTQSWYEAFFSLESSDKHCRNLSRTFSRASMETTGNLKDNRYYVCRKLLTLLDIEVLLVVNCRHWYFFGRLLSYWDAISSEWKNWQKTFNNLFKWKSSLWKNSLLKFSAKEHTPRYSIAFIELKGKK